MRDAIGVGFFGMLGVMIRYAVGKGLGPDLSFPVGTLAINAVGSFLAGLTYASAIPALSSQLKMWLMVGFLGGFTTFSSFSADAWKLYEAGSLGKASCYVVLSLLGGLLCVVLGVKMGRAYLS